MKVCLHYALWDGLPAEVRAVFADLMGGDPEMARDFYRLYFYWFNVAHEMAHVLIAKYGAETLSPGSAWQEEQAVNDFAAAYWRHRGQGDRLRRLGKLVEGALSRMVDPVPPGQSAEAFFDQNYLQLAQNPQHYGFFQFSFVQAALGKQMDLYTALHTLICPDAVLATPQQRLQYFEIDDQLPAAIIQDLRDCLKPFGVLLPPVAVRADAGSMIQYVEMDRD